MAATDRNPPSGRTPEPRAWRADAAPGAILIAALALPGLAPDARAENAPERPVLAFKDLYYQDFQSGSKRVSVNAPSLYAQVPFGDHFGVEASAVVDSVSGATPRYYTNMSGASRMEDTRKAADVKFTWYGERSGVSLGASRSQEHDYTSNAASIDLRMSTADNNTTFNIGAGIADDSIHPSNDIVDHESKRTWQGIAGVTQALSRADLVQVQAGYAEGHGYYDDPYKLFDHRPDHRRQTTGTLRWNHYFEYSPSTLRTTYRWYGDSYGIRAHTVELEWADPLSVNLEWTSSLRYDTQNAARFYIDPPDGGTPFPVPPEGAYSSLDQRLAAFGAVTIGQKLAWRVAHDWTIDTKVEYSEQRSGWRPGGGSPGIDPFRYVAIQFGIAYRF